MSKSTLRWAVNIAAILAVLLAMGAARPTAVSGSGGSGSLPPAPVQVEAVPCKDADPQGVFAFPTWGYMGAGFSAHSGWAKGIDIWTQEPVKGCSCKDKDAGCAAVPGNEVRAAFDGTVQVIYWGNHTGNWNTQDHTGDANWAQSVVVVKHTDVPGVTGNVYTLYQHMADQDTAVSTIEQGLLDGTTKSVKQGDLLGHQGNWRYDSGDAKITHLHFEISCDNTLGPRTTVDPVKWLDIEASSCDASYWSFGVRGDALALLEQPGIVVSSPGEELGPAIDVRNTGNTTWQPGDGYALKNESGAWDGLAQVSLTEPVEPADTARIWWDAAAPDRLGIHSADWRMVHGDSAFGPTVRITVIVLPADAEELRTKIRQAIEEAKQSGESREGLLERLKRMITDTLGDKWEEAQQKAEEEIEKVKQGIIQAVNDWFQERLEQICGGAGLVLVPALLLVRRRRCR